MLKRIISVFVVLMILSSVCFAYEYSYYKKAENPLISFSEPHLPSVVRGTVVIEAEDCDISQNATVIDDLSASGSKAVKFTAKKSITSIDSAEKTPTIIAEFANISPVTLTMWARVKVSTTSNDTVFWTVGKRAYEQKSLSVNPDYYWVNFAIASLSDETGSFAFKYRETGFIVDKFIFTSDSSFVPSGKDDIPQNNASERPVGIQSRYPEAQIKPIEGHPRVFLTDSYIKQLKEHVKTPELQKAWEVVKKTANATHSSILPNKTDGNYDSAVVEWIQCRALLYAMGEKDAAYAKETIKHATNVLDTVIFPDISDITRQMGTVMTMGAVVYDWCYDQMTETDKKHFIGEFKELCSMKEIGYPPSAKIVGIGGHMGEYEIHRDMLSCGIACYDEDPEMYELAAGALFSRYTESRKLFNSAGNHPNGSAYGLFRMGCELYADLLMQRMGYEPIYGEDMQKVMLRYIYARRPDGLMLKDGDDYSYSGRSRVTAYHTNDWTALIALNGLYDEPYSRGQFLRELSQKSYTADAFWLIICADPGKEAKYTDDLPLAYKTTYPLTSVFHRTSWQPGMDSDAALAQFKAYERHIGDHMHLDAGHFSIYYKGNLAIDSGNYQGRGGGWGSDHAFSYDKRSISHNIVTVYDPSETFVYNNKTYSNDGGQRMRVNTIAPDYESLMSDDWLYAKTEGTYIGPQDKTPAFSYLKSDLTPAYSSKVKDYTRSMVFIDLFDKDYPAAFVVYDNITSSDKAFEKKWLLHSIEEPTVTGNTTVIQRTEDGYNGKLVNKTMLPAEFTIEKVGGDGKEAWVDGKNYPNADSGSVNSEQGKWRIELSPQKASENDTFLNAMYVTDADGNLAELPMYQESMSGFVGVTVKDRTVLFAQDTNVKSSNIGLTIRDNGYNEVQCLIADLEPGIWNISGKNGLCINVEAKQGEGIIVFNASPGAYMLSKADSNEVSSQIFKNRELEMHGDFIIYNKPSSCYLRCEKPNKLIDGIPYVPAKTFFKMTKTSIEWNSELGCAVATRGQNSAMLYEGAQSFEFKGNTVNLSAPIVVIDGVMYVPILDFKVLVGSGISYDDVAKILNISIIEPSKEITDVVDIENDVLEPISIEASGDDGNIPENAADYSISSRWSCKGDNCWIEYDLGGVYDIGSVLMAFHSGNKRSTIIDIDVSDDRINYKRVYTGQSSGTTLGLEEFKVNTKGRFVKVTGHGTNLKDNLWNSITEFIVTKMG